MLTIATWIWGDKYSDAYLERLVAGVRQHLSIPHRFLVVSDRYPSVQGIDVAPIVAADRYLLGLKGCFVRLRMFDPGWQEIVGIRPGDYLACVDLDAIVTGPLDPIFDRTEDFCILQGANAANPCPYNGSLMMLRAGAHPDVWWDFSVDAAQRTPYYEFPDDQGWLWHKIPDAAGWRAGACGVYAFMKPGWPKGSTALPSDARLVAFPGSRDPSQFTALPWVRRHWLREVETTDS